MLSDIKLRQSYVLDQLPGLQAYALQESVPVQILVFLVVYVEGVYFLGYYLGHFIIIRIVLLIHEFSCEIRLFVLIFKFFLFRDDLFKVNRVRIILSILFLG